MASQEAFQVKIDSMKEILARLQHGKTPTAADYSTLKSLTKYFKEILIKVHKARVVKGNTKPTLWLQARRSSDASAWPEYLASFAPLKYCQLHDLSLSMMQSIPFAPETKDVCACIIELLFHTMVLVEDKIRNDLPLQLAYLLSKADFEFHALIVDGLSDNLLPMCFACRPGEIPDEYLIATIPTIASVMFEFVMDPLLQMKLLDCLMVYKKDLWKDLLMVIAFCSKPIKICAVKYLFHYWPELNSTVDHTVLSRVNVPNCERHDCSSVNADIAATSLLFDPTLSAHYGLKNAPLYVCDTCMNHIHEKNEDTFFISVLLQNETMSCFCENKYCLSQNKQASVTLCANYITNKLEDVLGASLPNKRRTRYCLECFNNFSRCFGDGKLLVQHSMINPCHFSGDDDLTLMVAGITSLLNERYFLPTDPALEESDEDLTRSSYFYVSAFGTDSSASLSEIRASSIGAYNTCGACRDNLWNTKGGVQGQFGIWILLSVWKWENQMILTQVQLKKVCSSVIQWCTNMTCLPDDAYGSKIENLKIQLIRDWLDKFSVYYPLEFKECLLPQGLLKDVSRQ